MPSGVVTIWLVSRVMVVVDADLAFRAESQALHQANPDVATGLETGQIVLAVFVVLAAPPAARADGSSPALSLAF